MPAESYVPGAYGRDIAEDYDDLYQAVPETDEAVEAIAALAAGGKVLELGIGTGRLALPLRERGLEVHGIEGSPEMAEQLRAKPGGDEIPVTIGDFAEAGADGPFNVVVLALHTIFGLPTPEHQIRCFENAARHLVAGGLFVVEARVLDPSDFKGGQAVEPRFFDERQAEIQIQRFDEVSAIARIQEIALLQQTVERIVSPFRGVEPAIAARGFEYRIGLHSCSRFEDVFRELV